MSADPKTPLDGAREALAEYDAPVCGAGCDHYNPGHLMPEPGRCQRRVGHGGAHDADERPAPDADHLRAALAEVDRLTAENTRLREERDKWRTYCEGARESVAALTAERDEARQQLAEALARVEPAANTGDCRTCKWADTVVCHHPEGKRKNSPVWTWCAHALAEDLMTRLGTSPPCPGYARKES